jgi:hypothetical protein
MIGVKVSVSTIKGAEKTVLRMRMVVCNVHHSLVKLYRVQPVERLLHH